MIPVLFTIFLAVIGIYFIAMGQYANQLSPSRQRWHLASFLLGLLVTLMVFIPSPDLFGPNFRFTVGMGQMLLAIELAPLLLFSGIPAEMQKRWNVWIHNLAKPQIAGTISTVILLSWFVPIMFETASRSLPIWILKQILFLISGLLFWWPVVGHTSISKPSFPVQLFYLFVARLPMTILGIIFTLAGKIIYASRSFALEICAPSSLSDQQAGGLVMWTVGGMIIFAIFSIIFFRMFNKYDAAAS